MKKINYNKKVSNGGSETIGKIKLPICEIEIVKGYFSSDWTTVSIGLRARFHDGSYIDYSTIAYTKNKNWKKKVKDIIMSIKKNQKEIIALDAVIQKNRKEMNKYNLIIEKNRDKIAKIFGAKKFFIANNKPKY